MDGMQEQKRMELYFRAGNALQIFCSETGVSFMSALYFLNGYTGGEMRIDDALLLIKQMEEAGTNFK